MFMHVDLPEPLGPITATNSPALNAQIDATQGAHFAFALAIDLGDLRQLDDWRGAAGMPVTAPELRYRR